MSTGSQPPSGGSQWSQQPSPSGATPRVDASPPARPHAEPSAPTDLNAAAATQAKTLLRKSNPLRTGMPWPIIMIQGLLATAIGIYSLVESSNALKNIMTLIGMYLLVNGLLGLITSLRTAGVDPRVQKLQLIRAGVAIVPGLVVTINGLSDFMTGNSARWWVALGLIGVAVVTLVGMILARDETSIKPASFAMPLLFLVWGGYMMYNASRDKDSIRALGIVITVLGIALIGLGYIRFKAASEERARKKAAKQAPAKR